MEDLSDKEPLVAPVLPYGTTPRRRRLWIGVVAVGTVVLWLCYPKMWAFYRESRERNAIRHEFRQNLDLARLEQDQKHWEKAIWALDDAILASSKNPSIFQTTELIEFRTKIAETESSLRQHIKSQNPENIYLLDGRRYNAICVRTNVIHDLTACADQLVYKNRMDEALQTIDQILILQPDNVHGQKLRAIVEADLKSHPRTATTR